MRVVRRVSGSLDLTLSLSRVGPFFGDVWVMGEEEFEETRNVIGVSRIRRTNME